MSIKPQNSPRGRPGDKPAAAPSSLSQVREELLARLVVHDPATQAVRHLYLVHKELGKNGWAAVEAMAAPLLGRALAEAEMQQAEDPSPVLQVLVDRLRQAHEAAQPLVLPEPLILLDDDAEWEMAAVPEVSETSYDEWELMERSWIGTVPSGLEVPTRTR